MASSSDPTDRRIVIRPAAPPRRRGSPLLWLALPILAIAGFGLATLHRSPAPAPPSPPAASLPIQAAPTAPQAAAVAPAVPAPLPTPPPPAAAPAAQQAPIPIVTANEAQILANRDAALSVFRFGPNPRILVLDFASLSRQAMMLNRVAALSEKSGLPRDRILSEAELNAAIRDRGETPETFYYGHDYSAATLARFFELAEAQKVQLNPEEKWLRTLLDQEGLLAPGARGAVISIPQAGSGGLIDASARKTILHHELSHGEYFTEPAYAAYVHRFWQAAMTEQERARFSHFLAEQGYDVNERDLVINETQAYLMHTADPRFFNADVLGLPPKELARLQDAFLLGMPQGWLRDCTSAPSAPPVAPARAAPRRRSQRAEVSRRRAWPATRTPRPRAASIAARKSRK